MRSRLILSTIAILVATSALTAVRAQSLPESPRFGHLTMDDGLPDPSVRAMVQDDLGFLWFGTQNGLVRYDGRTLAHYAPVDSATGRPRVLATLALLEDRDGDLWIGTFSDGLWRLRPDLRTFEHWGPSESGVRRLEGRQVEGLCQGDDGRALPSGLYFARFAANGEAQVRKMTLVR